MDLNYSDDEEFFGILGRQEDLRRDRLNLRKLRFTEAESAAYDDRIEAIQWRLKRYLQGKRA